VSGPHIGWGAVFTAELHKLVTLRSIRNAALLSILLPIGLAAVSAGAVGEGLATNDPSLAPGTTAETVGLEWVVLAQIGMIVCGVIAGSSEYSSGQLKTSLTAVPRRTRLMLAKAAALALLSAVTALLAIPAFSLVSQLMLGPLSVVAHGVPTSLVLRWLGGVTFWVGMSLIGFALGVLLRQALVPVFVLVVVSQLSLMLVVASSWSRFLPTVSGVFLFDPDSITAAFPRAALSAPAAWLTFVGWLVVLLAAATIVFQRRDAAR
jgi:ABC-type transport system involved in multi-copper enzyme maturation permease subunit